MGVDTGGLVQFKKPVSELLVFVSLVVPLMPCDLANLPSDPVSPLKPYHAVKGGCNVVSAHKM